MKIAIASVQVPFLQGGAEYLAENLKKQLVIRGYEADIITIPFKWYPPSALLDGMLTSQLVDLSEVNGIRIDCVIALKFPMYFIKHPNKILWLVHQHRQAYDLWGTEFSDLEHMHNGQQVREIIINADNNYIRESKRIFSISKTVIERLKYYNGIHGEALYHPPVNSELMFTNDPGDFIFYPSRLHEIKRQHLLIEAMAKTKSQVKLYLAGKGEEEYTKHLNKLIEKYGLKDRIKMLGLINEDEKIKLYADSCMVYNGPFQEDYGYVTLEAYFSGKPVLTHTDSGGPLEFVENEINGYIVEPDPLALAEKIDYLFENKQKAISMGRNGRKLMDDLEINWDHVIERLIP